MCALKNLLLGELLLTIVMSMRGHLFGDLLILRLQKGTVISIAIE